MAVSSNHAHHLYTQQLDLKPILFEQGNALCCSTQTSLVMTQEKGKNRVI